MMNLDGPAPSGAFVRAAYFPPATTAPPLTTAGGGPTSNSPGLTLPTTSPSEIFYDEVNFARFFLGKRRFCEGLWESVGCPHFYSLLYRHCVLLFLLASLVFF